VLPFALTGVQECVVSREVGVVGLAIDGTVQYCTVQEFTSRDKFLKGPRDRDFSRIQKTLYVLF
jgi:hypothetical protein